MVWLGVLTILVYVVGMYAVLIYAVFEAPYKWRDLGFRRRFRFVFARWRPHACGWGLLMLARNFLITMVPVAAHGMVLRSAAFVVLTTAHAFGEAWYQPWLSLMNNVVEIAMSLALIIMSVGSLTGGGDATAQSFG